MAGTVIADRLEAASTSQLVIENGVANTPPTIVDVNGTQIGTFCRAWVNFNGTGTVAIRASFNVSSITDNGTGDYTVNFTNAMPDANYSVSACVGDASTASSIIMLGTNSAGATPNFQTNSVDIFAQNNAQIFQDKSFMCISVFR